jgi:hypothetical protein
MYTDYLHGIDDTSTDVVSSNLIMPQTEGQQVGEKMPAIVKPSPMAENPLKITISYGKHLRDPSLFLPYFFNQRFSLNCARVCIQLILLFFGVTVCHSLQKVSRFRIPLY